MAKRMLIDATHPEETRVVILSGSRLEEFDFETSTKKQVKGNIYLAKVTRVEPSLQAAFVEYGGNRHGFLAFSEIHPDYYRIPVADREALLAEQAADDEDEEEFEAEPRRRQRRPRRGERRDGGRAARSEGEGEGEGGAEPVAADDTGWDHRPAADRDGDDAADGPEAGHPDEPDLHDGADPAEGADTVEGDGVEGEGSGRPPPAMAAADGLRVPSLRSDRMEPHAGAGDEQAAPAAEAGSGEMPAERREPAVEETVTEESAAEQPAASPADVWQPVESATPEPSAGPAVTEAGMVEPDRDADAVAPVAAEAAEARDEEGRDDEARDQEGPDDAESDEGVAEAAPGGDDNGEGPLPTAEEEAERSEAAAAIETLGGDELEDVRRRRQRSTRQYKIQEVIKRRQIMLVQVTKEERGNKGAALTTYLSLAGRYCVLMPNAGRSGGGVSRKIVNPVDRRRLKSLIEEMQLAEGMSVIVRTAGSERTRAEIKRDLEYLMRLWDEIRELTMQSTAPALVYEEGKLIKRAIRDLYSRDIDEILVEGEDAYREAKDFMRMLMPSHAKRVQPYRDPGVPLFNRFQIDQQIDAIHSPVVQLKSGGYIVINPTEALVAIDVNSGRSTRERNIEETAYRTNLEAADEIARQLRLRDLAGLIVIDFIDMEEGRNQHAVERRLKEAMKVDRARIQIGRISPFGLLELSRQRLRPSIFETSTQPCPHCGGTGHIRSTESTALHVLRAIEEEGLRRRSAEIRVTVPTAVALYVLNQKRAALSDIERRYAFDVVIDRDDELIPPDYRLERLRVRAASEAPPLPAPLPVEPEDDDLDIEDEVAEDEAEEAAAEAAESVEAQARDAGDEEDGGRRRRRRRRRRDERGPSEERGRGEAEDAGPAEEHPAVAAEGEATSEPDATAPAAGETVAAADEGEDDEEGEGTAETAGDDDDQQARRRRRRGRRGGRRRSRREDEGQGEAGAEAEADEPVAAVAAPAVAMPLDPRAAVEALFEALEAQHEVRADAPKAEAVTTVETVDGATAGEAVDDPWRIATASESPDTAASPAEPEAVPQPDVAAAGAEDRQAVAPDAGHEASTVTGGDVVSAESGDFAAAAGMPEFELVGTTDPGATESTAAVPAAAEPAAAEATVTDTAVTDAGPVALPLVVAAPATSAQPAAGVAVAAGGPTSPETAEPAPAATSEPVVTTPAEPARPPRKGWWQRLVETR